jgi:hypothetical protein
MRDMGKDKARGGSARREREEDLEKKPTEIVSDERLARISGIFDSHSASRRRRRLSIQTSQSRATGLRFFFFFLKRPMHLLTPPPRPFAVLTTYLRLSPPRLELS